MERQPRRHHRSQKPWVPSVRFNPLGANQPAYSEGVTTAVEGALIILAAADSPAEGGAENDDSIGVAGVVEGTVIAMRVNGTAVALEVDSPVNSGDLMETGTDSSLGLVFVDETTFTMGEDSVSGCNGFRHTLGGHASRGRRARAEAYTVIGRPFGRRRTVPGERQETCRVWL